MAQRFCKGEKEEVEEEEEDGIWVAKWDSSWKVTKVLARPVATQLEHNYSFSHEGQGEGEKDTHTDTHTHTEHGGGEKEEKL